MFTMIVSYDSKSLWSDYNGLLRAIKSYDWILLTDCTYAIVANDTPQKVFERLRPFMDQAANIYVIGCKAPFAGFGPQSANNWLVKNLQSKS